MRDDLLKALVAVCLVVNLAADRVMRNAEDLAGVENVMLPSAQTLVWAGLLLYLLLRKDER